MAQLKTVPRLRVELDVSDLQLARESERILEARGLSFEIGTIDDWLPRRALLGWAPGSLERERTAALGEVAAEAAAAKTPLCLLAPPRNSGPRTESWAANLAYLRANGALITSDPDVWIETIVLCACFGVPPGPTVAIVAPPGSYLAHSARVLAAESALYGLRSPELAAPQSALKPTDCVLVDRGQAQPESRRVPLVIPVIARAEVGSDGPALVGLRAAIAAVRCAGELGLRIADGVGQRESGSARFAVDAERLERQLARLERRAGDHETKVLLASYGVPITRQAVATTPSAAIRIAKRAGYPVELKPWGADLPSELEDCPVESDVRTAADVRRAFAVLTEGTGTDAVIVRAAVPMGRELHAVFASEGPLGQIIHVEIDGVDEPLAIAGPCHKLDALAIADKLTASRADDAAPDRDTLAELLMRASQLVFDRPRIERLELARIVVGSTPEEVVVADARAWLR